MPRYKTLPCVLLAGLSCCLSVVHAQDWTVTMPSVGTVLQAVEQYTATREFTGRHGDPDSTVAAQLGTLRGLRRLMIDITGIQELAQMPASMRAQTEQYLWAELAIVLRARNRLASGEGGWMVTQCRNPRSNFRTAYPRNSPEQCLLSLLHQGSGSYEVSYGYHVEIWSQLFPVQTAAHYVELTRSKVRTSPRIDQVLKFTAEPPALPPGITAPTYSRCATWNNYSAGTELCRLIARGCQAAPIPSYAQFEHSLRLIPAPAPYEGFDLQWIRVGLDAARRVKHGPTGVIYGPFRSSEEAVVNMEPLARAWTNALASELEGLTVLGYAEVVTWVIHRRGAPTNSEYYLTTLARSEFNLSPGGNNALGATGADYWLSVDKSFEGNCELIADFEPVDAVHTHPDGKVLNLGPVLGLTKHDSFSDLDLAFPAFMRTHATSLGVSMGGFYLLRYDRCIFFIAGSSTPRLPSDIVHVPSPACPRV